MSLSLRAFLVIAALLTLFFVLRKIRKSQLKTSDGIFWFFLVLCLAVVAVFPQIVYWLSSLLGIASPANFVFMAVVAILLIKEFTASLEVSKLQAKLSQLAQDEALRDNEQRATDHDDS